MLPRQLFADRFQFPPTLRSCRGICHLKLIKGTYDNSGNDQPGVLLVIGGNDIPGRVTGAFPVQAILVSIHVIFPELFFVNVRGAELPILILKKAQPNKSPQEPPQNAPTLPQYFMRSPVL
jgi:hypothetical protein